VILRLDDHEVPGRSRWAQDGHLKIM
jgi:hypothetical protein